MKEIKADIWNYYFSGNTIGITTNGFIKKDGTAVMGAGIAKQAAQNFPELSAILGNLLKERGNKVSFVPHLKLMFFPVKHNWREPADLELIEKSCKELQQAFKENKTLNLYLVRPGCQNGKRNWSEIKPIMEKYFKDEDRLTICDLAED